MLFRFDIVPTRVGEIHNSKYPKEKVKVAGMSEKATEMCGRHLKIKPEACCERQEHRMLGSRKDLQKL